MIIGLRALKYFIVYIIVSTTCRSVGLGIVVTAEGIKTTVTQRHGSRTIGKPKDWSRRDTAHRLH